MEENSSKEYLTVNEACRLLGLCRMTIYKLIKNGKLEAINTGRKYLVINRPSMTGGIFAKKK